MNPVPGDPSSSDEPKPPGKGSWRWSRWLLLIGIVLVVHVLLIFTFGGRKPIIPRATTDAPKLELATGSSEWLLLNDPTLFALPNREGFAGPAWLEPPHVQFRRLEWTEPPRWLQLPVGDLGAVFNEFMQTNHFAVFRFDLTPPPRFTAPVVPLEPQFAEASTLRLAGAAAQRPLLTPLQLPSWPYLDVLAPSQVQVLVNPAGAVVSVVLLSSSGYDTADQRALELARAVHFAPALDLTVGQLIFDWHTVALPATNAPVNP